MQNIFSMVVMADVQFGGVKNCYCVKCSIEHFCVTIGTIVVC
jgi:hypothetical protein